ncbi:GTP-binding protein 2-like isoform X3 [Gordionus sp. m RMFG-2023]|uniref:GTP-binding protein 2-like isoform X3 n=1 Tax=Gordionus sp. m RMFG-2023 TaxID=3053472 RepID=UPI0031FDAF76
MNNSKISKYKYSMRMPPELEEGNIEYKLKLINPTNARLENLITQMKWRLREGNGEAIYELGVEDQGYFAGLSKKDLELSKITLKRMAQKLGATMQILREKEVISYNSINDLDQIDDQKFICEVLVRKISEDHTLINYVGPRTVEEIYETSTKLITFLDLAGFHKYQKTTIFGLTNYSPDYVMLLIDSTKGLVGTSKEHLGLALALNLPIFILITKIDIKEQANSDEYNNLKNLTGSTNNLVAVLQALKSVNKLPFMVKDFNHARMAAKNMSQGNVVPVLEISCITGCNLALLKIFLQLLPPYISTQSKNCLYPFDPKSICKNNIYSIELLGIQGGKKLESKKRKVDQNEINDKLKSERLVDDLFMKIDGDINSIKICHNEELAEFLIDEVFSVDGVKGIVVSGIMSKGIVQEGKLFLVGPFKSTNSNAYPSNNNAFKEVLLVSIRRCRMIKKTIKAGDCGTLALQFIKYNESYEKRVDTKPNQNAPVTKNNLVDNNSIIEKGLNDFQIYDSTSHDINIKKGMVLVHPDIKPIASFEFEAQICILYHATAITIGFQISIYVRNIRQTAIIISLDKDYLKTGQSGIAVFRFIRHPEYLKIGSKLIFREASTRGIGLITRIITPGV